MTKSSFLAAAAVLGVLIAAPAQAQNFLGMDLNAANNAFNARLNGAMATNQTQIMQSNLNNPQVMAAYRAGVCGYGLTPQQFAYKWAATGGCTAAGTRYYMNNEARNRYNEQQAYQGYRQAQDARSQAMQAQQQGFYNNQYQAGMQLGGWNYNYLPNGGTYWYR